MRLPRLALMLLALSCPTAAGADPVGTFSVRGANPDNGGQYTGTVRVARTGDTYKVIWNTGGDPLNGIGIGMKMVDGRMVPGPASADDVGISIAYSSGDSVGTVVYFEQPDGTWHGVWAYEGWKQTSTEFWYPKNKKTVTQSKKDSETEIRSVRPKPMVTSPLPTQAGPKS